MHKRSLSKEEIVEAIRNTANSLGKTPSRTDFIAQTGINEYHVLKCFESWNSAVTAAGLDPYVQNIQIDDDALLEDWAEVVRKLRQIPTRVQYNHYGKFHTGTFEHHFGPWSGIPEKFRKFVQDKLELKDVLVFLPILTPSPSEKAVDLQEKEMLSGGRKGGRNHSAYKVHSKLVDRPIYGNPIDFRGLRHEPVNENGVIFLFGIVARELGYSVEAVQAGFPDCEAKRQIDVGKWQHVRIEFEFESKNFRDHGHSIDACDVIVCWRHNWPDCPKSVEVLELASVINGLGKSDI